MYLRLFKKVIFCVCLKGCLIPIQTTLGSLMAGYRKTLSINTYKHCPYCVCYRNGNFFKLPATFDVLDLF